MFAVLDDLSAALTNNDSTAISAQMALLDQGSTQALAARAAAGSRVQQLDMSKKQLENAEDIIDAARSGIENADTVKAVIDLKTAQNVYDSALAAGANVFQKSLMDFLR
jgi:flagellar hook-associated protein 3 FlgL